MRLQSILNRVQKCNSFVYERVERGGRGEGEEPEALAGISHHVWTLAWKLQTAPTHCYRDAKSPPGMGLMGRAGCRVGPRKRAKDKRMDRRFLAS
jgi:hypothetical protein